MEQTFDLFLRRYNHITWVQSSINNTNHLAPEMLGIGEGPYMSLWIKLKGRTLWVLLRGNEALLCLANWQISHWNSLLSNPLNKEGYID